MSARRAGRLVSEAMVGLRLVRPVLVEATSLCSAAESEAVSTLEAVILAVRAAMVVKRRPISQSPKARTVSTVAPAFMAAACAEQTLLPDGPVGGVTAAAAPTLERRSAPPRARPANMAAIRVFTVYSLC